MKYFATNLTPSIYIQNPVLEGSGYLEKQLSDFLLVRRNSVEYNVRQDTIGWY